MLVSASMPTSAGRTQSAGTKSRPPPSGTGAVGTITPRCGRSASSTVSGERNQLTSSSSTRLGSSTVTEYYRIIVRTEGVRDTVSFTETLVHF